MQQLCFPAGRQGVDSAHIEMAEPRSSFPWSGPRRSGGHAWCVPVRHDDEGRGEFYGNGPYSSGTDSHNGVSPQQNREGIRHHPCDAAQRVNAAEKRREQLLRRRQDALASYTSRVTENAKAAKELWDAKLHQRRERYMLRQEQAAQARCHHLAERSVRMNSSRVSAKHSMLGACSLGFSDEATSPSAGATPREIGTSTTDLTVCPQVGERVSLSKCLALMQRGPALMKHLSDAGLTPDYSSNEADDTASSSSPGGDGLILANDDAWTHHLHLSPLHVKRVLQSDPFVEATPLSCSVSDKQPGPASHGVPVESPAGIQRTKQRKLVQVAAELLRVLEEAADGACVVGDPKMLVLAFLNAAYYRNDSFGQQRLLQPTSATGAEPTNSVHSDSDNHEASSADALLALPASELEASVNREAARVVNALFFISDRLNLVLAMSPLVALPKNNEDAKFTLYDLPEQIDRFAACWRKYNALVAAANTAQRQEVIAHSARQQLRSLQSAHSVLRRGGTSSNAKKGKQGMTSSDLRQLKSSDLVQGVEWQLSSLTKFVAASAPQH